MEFFREPKIDWMGRKWVFIGASLTLLFAGIVSVALHRGLVYGIDFRGGTLVYVKFAKAPNLDDIRRALDVQALSRRACRLIVERRGFTVVVSAPVHASLRPAMAPIRSPSTE